MTNDVKIVDDVAIIKVHGNVLDALSAREFRQDVMKLSEEGFKSFIIDLSTISFIDSAGLGVIILLHKTTGAEGNIALCGVQQRVHDVLHMVNMKHLISIDNTVETALQKIHST
jgi:anti-sigma B factor antagonist